MASSVIQARTYNVWMLVERASDLPGVWTAECLDFGVVSQGGSLQDALRMGLDAAVMFALDELGAGRDPHMNRSPEDEGWQHLRVLMNDGQRFHIHETTDMSKLLLPSVGAGEQIGAFAVQARMCFYRNLDDSQAKDHERSWSLEPLAMVETGHA